MTPGELVGQKKWQELYDLADAAGHAAATRAKPTPMVVTQHENPMDESSPVENSWYVSEGVCGFAWITLRPGTHSFVKWMSKEGLSRSAYGGGHQIWVSGYNQSMDRKFAYASAFAAILTEAFAGTKVEVYAQSRMD